MKTPEEARGALQIAQEDIDFLVDGIRRAGEPIAVIAYGPRRNRSPIAASVRRWRVGELLPLLGRPRVGAAHRLR